MRVAVDAAGTGLLRGGRPFFYTADTAWLAFTRPTDEEWEHYCRLRAEQGFTAVQTSLLPIPHEVDEPAGALDDAALARAAARVALAGRHGLTCAVALLWANYVPGTWAARDGRHVLTSEQSRDLVRRAAAALAPHEVVFFVSGDTDFPAAATRRYAEALAEVRAVAPHCLTALHTQPRAVVPPELADGGDLDLHVFQSGHTAGERDQRVLALAEHYASARVRRPVIDVEPCYELHGHGHAYGRFTAADVRRASWTAVLAGASAGIGYGAHGVWQWHRAGQPFAGEAFSSTPHDWREAVLAPGALDVTGLRAFVEEHGLHGLRPAQHLLRGAPDGVRAAQVPDGSRAVVYAPWPTALRVAVPDPPAWSVAVWTLEDRRRRYPRVQATGGVVGVDGPAATGDAVVLLTRTVGG